MEFLEKLEATARWVDIENRRCGSDELIRALGALENLTSSKNILAMVKTLKVAEKVAQGTCSMEELNESLSQLKIATVPITPSVLTGARAVH